MLLTPLVWVAICIPLVTSAIDLFLPGQAGYPGRLDALGKAPALYVRGALAGGQTTVAIVGARAASGTGMARAHAIARHLATASVHVVSGGALGIDGAAHRGSLAGNGTTTVVLGSGVDVAYPVRHAGLFDQIVARGGALVSIFPSGMQPRPGTFVKRNRVIAALSDAVLVVEADVKSGSMSTAHAARQLGRVLAACPGSPGANRLLAHGAALVETGDDVLAALAGAPRVLPVPELDPDATAVRDAIRAGARSIDAITRKTGLSVGAVLRALPQLESCPARMQ
jgi:DNA processing protein